MKRAEEKTADSGITSPASNPTMIAALRGAPTSQETWAHAHARAPNPNCPVVTLAIGVRPQLLGSNAGLTGT